MPDKPARPFQVLVTWEQFEMGGWRQWADPRYYATAEAAQPVYAEMLNFNGYKDPGRSDIRNVSVELRHKGELVSASEGPCSPGRNQYWLGEVRKKVESCTGPLANALKKTL